MFQSKIIEQLKNDVTALSAELQTARASIIELTDMKASLQAQVENLMAEKGNLEQSFHKQIEEIQASVNQQVQDQVIDLAASAGMEAPILQAPEAEANEDLGASFSQITDPVERSKFLANYAKQILNK